MGLWKSRISASLFLPLLLLGGATAHAAVDLRDEGTSQAFVWNLDCVGAGISCTTSGADGTLTVTGGGGGNSFETISVPAGTNPVADSATDTLTITETSFLTITGTAGTDTIDITQITTDLGTDGLIAANAVALTTDTTGNYAADVVDGAGIDVTGTAGEGWTATVNLLYTDTLAGNPAMNLNEARFSTDGTGGGILFEGAADTIEGLLVWNPTTADRTLTLPDASDTLVGRDTTDTLTNKTLAAASNVLDADTAVALAADPADCATSTHFAVGVVASGAATCEAIGDADIPDSTTVTGWVLGTSSATTFTAGTVNIDLLDGVGAVDMDYGSADITDHTFTTDGGTVILDGSVDASGTLQAGSGNITVTDATGNLDGTKVANADLGDLSVSSGAWTIDANAVDDANLAITESLVLPIYSAKLSGAFVVRTPTSGDASTQGAGLDGGDGNWRLLFDATTDEAAVWQFRLPDYWAAHSELNIMYSMTSATTLEVEFEADVMCITPGDSADVGTASFVGVAVASGTVPGTAGFPAELSLTLTDDACAAGDLMFLYLSTDANDATSDDATGDREVISVEYEFTR